MTRSEVSLQYQIKKIMDFVCVGFYDSLIKDRRLYRETESSISGSHTNDGHPFCSLSPSPRLSGLKVSSLITVNQPVN